MGLAISEDELQNAVIHAAKTLGYLVHHCRPAPTQSGRWATPIQGDKGFPDLVLVGRKGTRFWGRVLFVELKAEKGKLSPEQTEWISALDALTPDPLLPASGWTERNWHVWRPADWTSGEVERVLTTWLGAPVRADLHVVHD